MPALLQIIESLWLQIGPVLNYDLASSAARLSQGEAHCTTAPWSPPSKTRSRRRAPGAACGLLSASEYILARELLP